MAKERKLSVFMVMTENQKNFSRFPYYENAYTAQEAVDEVRRYKDDYEKILFVLKQVDNWR